jgi:hypothetical protein
MAKYADGVGSVCARQMAIARPTGVFREKGVLFFSTSVMLVRCRQSGWMALQRI